ncbi:MAG: hypothetical protein ABI587_00940 [Gemmatimonadales bacterium]
MEISLCRFGPATLLLLTACGGGRVAPTTTPDGSGKPRDVALDELYVLEVSGVPPEDTSVTFAPGATRNIILRHGPPDNTVFVELTFPKEAFGDSASPGPVTVTVHPRPGIYGVDVTTSAPPGKGSRIRFKYPVHFSAPIAGVTRYGSTLKFEHALAVAVLKEGRTYTLLPSTRPASDNLETPLAGTGTYLVAAPR